MPPPAHFARSTAVSRVRARTTGPGAPCAVRCDSPVRASCRLNPQRELRAVFIKSRALLQRGSPQFAFPPTHTALSPPSRPARRSLLYVKNPPSKPTCSLGLRRPLPSPTAPTVRTLEPDAYRGKAQRRRSLSVRDANKQAFLCGLQCKWASEGDHRVWEHAKRKFVPLDETLELSVFLMWAACTPAPACLP